jgi:hypothetical protein
VHRRAFVAHVHELDALVTVERVDDLLALACPHETRVDVDAENTVRAQCPKAQCVGNGRIHPATNKEEDIAVTRGRANLVLHQRDALRNVPIPSGAADTEHEIFEHTSVLSTVVNCFGLPAGKLGARQAKAKDVGEGLRLSIPRTDRPEIPAPHVSLLEDAKEELHSIVHSKLLGAKQKPVSELQRAAMHAVALLTNAEELHEHAENIQDELEADLLLAKHEAKFVLRKALQRAYHTCQSLAATSILRPSGSRALMARFKMRRSTRLRQAPIVEHPAMSSRP